MDQKTQSSVERFKQKYSDELSTSMGMRRRFSPTFKSDLLFALNESGLTQNKFAEAIGISLSVISQCRRKIISSKARSSKSLHHFQQIQIEESETKPSGPFYLQSPSGFQVHGLNVSQLGDLLRTL